MNQSPLEINIVFIQAQAALHFFPFRNSSETWDAAYAKRVFFCFVFFSSY